MKKIPTLFKREFGGNHEFILLNEITPGLEWVLEGEGLPTVKWDGACCAVIDGKFYKRYDAKKGKVPPAGAIPCQSNPDPVTGHWPHWLECDENKPEDKWFLAAFETVKSGEFYGLGLSDGILRQPADNITYEAVGPHFQGNPYGLEKDVLIAHGMDAVPLADRSFSDIQEYLKDIPIEGIVFWKDGIPQCKIKRSDFGFIWPTPEAKMTYIHVN